MAGDTFLVSGCRTPIGSMNGVLAEVAAQELGALCIKQALQAAGLKPDKVDEVIMGNVVGAGLGQNPARQAAIRPEVPVSVGATTVNKVCGSGLKAVMMGTQAIRLGDAQVVVAGGMESMSRAPYLLTKARQGYRMGNGELIDAMINDGLWDVYGNKHMGFYGDRCAEKCNLSRKDQDDFAVRSFTRARKAQSEGLFKSEIVPVPITVKKQTTLITEDEGPARFDEAKLRSLRPAFSETGTITAGNASSINDGAAALVLASQDFCTRNSLKPLARVVGYTTVSRLNPSGSPWPPSAPCAAFWTRSTGASRTRTCSRSTRPLGRWPWRPNATWPSPERRSMSAAGPWPWGIPSAVAGLACWSPCCTLSSRPAVNAASPACASAAAKPWPWPSRPFVPDRRRS